MTDTVTFHGEIQPFPSDDPVADDISQNYLTARETVAATEAAEEFRRSLPQPSSQVTPEAAPVRPQDTEGRGGEPEDRGFLMSALGEGAAAITDIPLQTIGAAVDVTREIGDITRPVWMTLDRLAPLGFVEGEFVHPFSDDELIDKYMAALEGGGGHGIAIPEAKTGAGDLYRNVMRFAIGFKGVGNVFRMAGVGAAATRGGQMAQMYAKGALADMLVWDEHEERLSDLIESYPALANPITEYLASDEDDGMFEGKLKQALEGAGLSVGLDVVTTLARSVKGVKFGRKAKESLEQTGEMELLREQAVREQRDFVFLGDPNGPRTIELEVPRADARVRAQLDEGVAGAGVDPAHAAGSTVTAGARGDVAEDTVKKVMPNFARISGDDDVKAVLREMAEASDIPAKRVTHAETEAIAKRIGISELLEADATRFNTAEMSAMADAYAASGQTLFEAADRALQAPNATNLFNFRKMQAVHQTFRDQFFEARSEAGRRLEILKRVSSTSEADRLLEIRSFVDEMGGEGAAKEMALVVASLKDAAPEAVDGTLKRLWKAKTSEAIQEAWILGLLSGPRTQARNLLSNAVFTIQNAGERAVASRLPGAEIEKGEAIAQLVGVQHSLSAAFVNAGRAYWNNTSGFGIGKVDSPQRRAIGSEALELSGPLGYMADVVGQVYSQFGRMLTAGDEFFKTINYHGEMAALAYRNAAQQGAREGDELIDSLARSLSDPSDEMRLAGRRAAQRATFTNELGKVGRHWQSMVQEWPLLRFITPFIRTPGNLFKEGFVRTPLAVMMPNHFWKEVRAGGARKDMALAKVASGSALMFLWSDMAVRGVLTGNGPSDPVERARLRDTGWQPYSLDLHKMGLVEANDEGRYVNYRAIEPIGTMLGLSADVTERLMEYQQYRDSDDPNDEDKLSRIAMSSVAAVGNGITSQTFTRSLSEFFSMMANPDFYAERWLQKYVRSVVPRAGASVDEIGASLGLNERPEFKEIYTMMDALKEGVPGWRDGLESVRDLWGYEVEKGRALGPDWLSPIWVGDASRNTPGRQLIVDQKIRINKPPRTASFQDNDTGQKAPMDLRQWPDVYDEYVRLQGHGIEVPGYGMTMDKLVSAIATGDHWAADIYNSLPDGDNRDIEDKGAFIKSIFQLSRQGARDAIMNAPEYDERFAEFRREVGRRATRTFNLQQGIGQ